MFIYILIIKLIFYQIKSQTIYTFTSCFIIRVLNLLMHIAISFIGWIKEYFRLGLMLRAI